MAREPFSLKRGLLITIIVCWLVPILIVSGAAGFLLTRSATRTALEEAETGAEGAMRQVDLRLSAAIESSKAVSYTGTVKNAYRVFSEDGDAALLYKTVSEYLTQNFSRDERVSAVYISFRSDALDACPYAFSSYAGKYLSLSEYRHEVEPDLFSTLGGSQTGIFFRVYNGNLYMVRNLLDLKFQSFAVLCMQLDTDVIFQALRVINPGQDVLFSLDGVRYALHADGSISEREDPFPGTGLVFTAEPDGHAIVYEIEPPASVRLPERYPELLTATAIASVLVLPLLFMGISIFKRHISRPVNVLIDATSRVRAGERGYTITEEPRSEEFCQLYEHFNEMSLEMKAQVEHIYMEQQALQQTKIKALQSQINPHFLNNTLEIINWEARLAENEKVSAMIEALSTLLNAALDRGGENMVSLRNEIGYVEAYLHIIRERLGNRLTAEFDVDEGLLEMPVPRLILQPIVENAIEHDIEPNHGGMLTLRVKSENEEICIGVEHTGTFSEEDRDVVGSLFDPDAAEETRAQGIGQIGLRNVYQRLRLIYGDRCRFSLRETGNGTILAEIRICTQPDKT